MQVIARELPGVLYYVLLTALLVWLLFRAPTGDSGSERRAPRWLPVAVFGVVGAGVLAGIAYEVFVKKVPPPCPCGLSGCPEPPACHVEEYIKRINEGTTPTP